MMVIDISYIRTTSHDNQSQLAYSSFNQNLADTGDLGVNALYIKQLLEARINPKDIKFYKNLSA